MLSNTFIVSEFVEILYSFPTRSCVKMCHTVPQPVPRTWQCVIWYPRPVPRTWQYVIWYHDQCISPGIMSYGTTTSVFHMAMCYAVPQPVYFTWQCVYVILQSMCFTWQCVMRYHDQCISPGIMSYGTTTSVFHLAMCHTVPQPVLFTWQCVMRYHDQCNLAIYHTVPQLVYFTWQCDIRYHNQCISPGNVLFGTTSSVFHLAMCYAVPQPIYFTGNVSYGTMTRFSPSNVSYATTTSAFHLTMCLTVPRPVPLTWQCFIRYQSFFVFNY